MTKIRHASIALLFMLLAPSLTHAGGSGVNGGGDVVTEYLETLRAALKISIARLIANPTEGDTLCASEPQKLNADQVAQCRDFILTEMKQIYALNDGSTPTDFERDQNPPLLVKDPFGQDMQVDAVTAYASTGPVTVDYDRVRSDPPASLLRVITHEFGHKVLYRGAYVTDNDAYAAFSRGREFLDAVGEGIADYAVAHALIGSNFYVLDHYFCQVFVGADNKPLGTQINGLRSSLGADIGAAYETGFGDSPIGNLLGAPALIGGKNVCLWLHLKTHEETGCSSTAPGVRWTHLELTQSEGPCELGGDVFANASPAGPAPDGPDQIAEQDFPNLNPACETQPPVLSISAQSIRFDCGYKGFTALANWP